MKNSIFKTSSKRSHIFTFVEDIWIFERPRHIHMYHQAWKG